jgi:hypothetical protein
MTHFSELPQLKAIALKRLFRKKSRLQSAREGNQFGKRL